MKKLLMLLIILGITSIAYGESGWQGDRAIDTNTDTTFFDGILSGNETNVQAALDILDDVSGSGAPTDADYLVGTANGSLSAEIPVGTTPGGELGGSWATPTVDATHSGSAHHSAATITCPDTNATSGQAITFADTGIMTISEAGDTITFDATEAQDIDAVLTIGATADTESLTLTGGTLTAEQVTSTDDASVAGDLIVREAMQTTTLQ